MSDLYTPEGKKPKVEAKFYLSPRPSTLKGKTVALYHNDKVASFAVMRAVADLMKKAGVKEVFEVHSKAPFMRHPDRAIEEALKADVVVAGTADWGSCTAWVVDAAVRIEKGGKPVVVCVAPPFREEVVSHTKMDGIQYLPFVVIDYKQEVLPLIPPAVAAVFDKIVYALTTPSKELEKKPNGEVL